MKIAAVVVTYNRIELLKESIQSLRSQTHNFDEIIVINNSSTDGTLNWLQTQTDLTVITQENLGSGGGQHTGIKYAYENGYDWIWCMDDDLVVYPNCLQTLVDFLNKDNLKIGTLQPLKQSDPNGIVHHGAEYIDLNTFSILDIFDKAKNLGYFITNSFCFEGVLINTSIIKKVGLPRKDFFITNDDREYAMRINSLLPKYNILLYGEVLMKRINRPGNSHALLSKLRIISDWDIRVFYSYFQYFFLSIKLHKPHMFSKPKAFLFLLRHKVWILKVFLSILLFHKNKIKKIRLIYNHVLREGIFIN